MRYRVRMTPSAVRTRPWELEGGLLRSPLLSSMGLVAGFTTRAFGSMGDTTTPREVQQRNRSDVATLLGFGGVARAKQVHGDEVVQVTDVPAAWPEADAMWAARRGLLLGVVAADCVPVLVASEDGDVLGVAHAGWRGTSLAIASRLVEAMTVSGGGTVVAALGPSIGPCCYTIDDERARLIAERLGPGNEDLVAGGRFDLWAANARQLLAAGVTSVEVSGICTRCGSADVWSYRGRDSHPEYGTCMAFLGRPEG
ncbi:MAG TPA: polyphenol oxidase family protein [Dehalococcoidia bacterium]|nr:polyphenol oxidase family protein [Dehalococcoidia bacterium]